MRTLPGSALFALVGLLALACSAGSTESDSSPTRLPGGAVVQALADATVLRVVDATTLEVRSDGQSLRVRYLGVSVPEAGSVGADVGSVYEQALQFNRFLVEGKDVQLERGAVETDTDGTLLRYVYVGGEMVNRALLTNGHATVADFPPAFRYRADFQAAEEDARNGGRGVWASTAAGVQDPAPAHGSPTASLPVPQFSGGTLPSLPSSRGGRVCDYSGTDEAIIKGNVDVATGERLYHVPDGLFYPIIVVEDAQGDQWFCTEQEAIAAGWKRSKR